MAEIMGKLIRDGETERLLLRPLDSSLQEILSDMASLANSHGGTIILGADDPSGGAGRPGRDEIEKTGLGLWKAAGRQIRPSLCISADVRDIEGRTLLVCTVPEGRFKPYRDSGGAIWVRDGAGRRRAEDDSETLDLYQSSADCHADLAGSARDLCW